MPGTVKPAHNKMVGVARQRHALLKQHHNLNILTSFPAALPVARWGAPGHPGGIPTQARYPAASSTGYMRTPNAPK